MKRNIIITSCILVILIFISYYFYAETNNSTNPPINNVSECERLDLQMVKNKAQKIQDNIGDYIVNSKDIMDRSSEGGIQKDYLLDDAPVLVEQTFYGETGKSEVEYYLQDGKVFYINKKNMEYVVPLFQDTSGEVKNTEVKDFYLDSAQVLCSWYSDGELQPNDQDSKDLVEYLITEL